MDSYKNSVIDLSTLRGSYSIENTKYIYTSISKINEAQNLLSDLNRKGYNKMPYIFSDKSVTGTTSANSITLPYQENTETNLYYSERTGAYTLYKGSAKCVDKLNGADVSFKNVFVLFANSTTYESADGKELTMDTYSGGSGYYASDGYLTEINWRLTDDGSLVFTTLNGEILEVNRGNAYVGYYKASVSSEVTVR